MPSAPASFFWVKYGFESVTPLKMYNANVSSAILLSFMKNTCAKDVEDLCKQKNIQLGIELDAINRVLQTRTPLATGRSAASLKSGAGSRPPSGAASSRPVTPTLHAGGNAAADDELTETLAKKTAIEAQIEVIAAASKLAKELIAGTAVVDLADDNGTRLKLDEANDARANTIVKSRAQYTVVAVAADEKGVPHVTPLVFKLSPEGTSRPSSGVAKSAVAT